MSTTLTTLQAIRLITRSKNETVIIADQRNIVAVKNNVKIYMKWTKLNAIGYLSCDQSNTDKWKVDEETGSIIVIPIQ